MAAEEAGGSASGLAGALAPGGLAALARDIAAGITVAVLVLPICIAAGVLTYGPLGPDYVAIGAVAGILSAVTGGIVGSICRTSSFIVTVPALSIGLIQASFATSVLNGPDGSAALVLVAFPLSALFAGLWLILFGVSGLSRVVKFTPYPVFAGFVTGIGLLIAVRQVSTLLGVQDMDEFITLIRTFALPRPYLPLFGIGLIVLMLLVSKFVPKVPVLLVGLVVGFIGYHGIHLVAPGVDLGPSIGPVSMNWNAMRVDLPATLSLMANIDFLQILLLSSLTLALLGTLDTFFVVRAVQNAVDVQISTPRDLVGQGVANLVTAFFGSLVVSSSLGLSMANYRGGGRTRMSMITGCIVMLAAALFFPSLIAALPLVVLAAIMMVTAIRIVDRWIIEVFREALRTGNKARRARARRSALVVLAVLGATVFGQPVMGAFVGLILACLLFIADMSRPIVRRRSDAVTTHSKRVRSRRDLDTLATVGQYVSVLELQGVLFFGNADDLASEIRTLSERSLVILIDLKRVSDIDISGSTALIQIAKRCQERNRHLVLCGAQASYADIIAEGIAGNDHAMMLDDLDAAMEWAEDAIIRARLGESSLVEQSIEEADLTQGMSDTEIDTLLHHMELLAYQPGEALCLTGDPADRLWIIKRGTVSIRVARAHGGRRLASLGPGCSAGEMGMLERQPRSADVIADDDVEAYVLTVKAFGAILRDHPRIGQSILINVSRQLAHRLRVTSEDLRMADS